MAKNEFLPFATEAGSLLQPLTGYANDDRRKHGNQPGIADPAFCNRTWRQSSLMAAALGELIAELGIDALDQNDVSKLKNAIKGAMTLLQQKGLSDSVTSESSTTAASSKAVNTVFKAISSAFVANSAVDDWDKATTLGANYFIAGNLPHGPTPNDSKAMFIVLVLAYSTDRIMQVALPHNMAINIHVRVQYNDYTWGSWRAYGRTIDPAVSARKLTDPVNISLTGDAAGSVSFDGSSSVAINTTVNAAAKLKTPRTITLTGGATGSASFDGSGNINIPVTVATSDATNSDAATPASSKAVKAAYDKASAASAQAETVKGNYTGNGGNIAPKDLPTYTVQFNMMSEDMPNQATIYKDCLLMNCYGNSDIQSKTLFAISKPKTQAEASSTPVQAWIAHAYKDDNSWQTRIAQVLTSEGGVVDKGNIVFSNNSAVNIPYDFNSWRCNLWFSGTLSGLYHMDSGQLIGFHVNKKIYFGDAQAGVYYGNIDKDGIHCNADSANKLNTARTINGIPFDGTQNIVLPNDGIIAQSLSGNGYAQFARGLIIQWGQFVGTQNVTFPIAFPTAVLSIAGSQSGTGSGEGLAIVDLSNTGFTGTLCQTGRIGRWIAIGK